jgi:hypothetical protein
MKIVQSYWSKPAASSDDGDVNARPKGGWNSSAYNLMSWTLSCLRLRSLYDEVELVTDNEGKMLLIDTLKLPYTKVSTDLENINESNTKLWSLGKLYTYALQEKPFIHVDGDFFIWKKFPKKLESAPLIAQHLEKDYWLYRQCLDHIQTTFPAIPKKLVPAKKILAANAGIMGGSDFGFFKDLFNEVTAFINSNRKAIDELNNGSLNIIIEQLFFYQLATEQNKKIEFLFKTMSDDFSDCLRFNLVPHRCSFIHVIGEAKKNQMVCDQLSQIMRFEYPEYFERIQQLCGNEHETPAFLHDFQNLAIWRSCKKGDVYDLPLVLSEQSSISKIADDSYTLRYHCPIENAERIITLDGISNVIHLLEKPLSVNDIIQEFEEFPSWNKRELSAVRSQLLNVLTSYLFYLKAIKIA